MPAFFWSAGRAGFGQHLEAVADADDGAAGGRNRATASITGEACDRARAQVVAVREPARDDDRVGPARLGLGVPEHPGRPAELLDRPRDIELAVRAREQDDAGAGARRTPAR